MKLHHFPNHLPRWTPRKRSTIAGKSTSLPHMKRIPKIISGGQAGADCTALDWALSRNLPCGGWCPKGRKAEDGSIPDAYPLRESTSASYLQRTEWNVRDSDGDLANAERRIQKNRRLCEEASEALVASSLEASRVRLRSFVGRQRDRYSQRRRPARESRTGCRQGPTMFLCPTLKSRTAQ